MQKKYGPDGLVVLAVNAWDEPKSKVLEFVRQKDLSHRVLLDGRDVSRRKYNVASVPTNLWIDKKGTIVHEAAGFEEGHQSDMELWVKKIIAG